MGQGFWDFEVCWWWWSGRRKRGGELEVLFGATSRFVGGPPEQRQCTTEGVEEEDEKERSGVRLVWAPEFMVDRSLGSVMGRPKRVLDWING
ncbi:hypothetical protein HAX54_033366 [Datura stramonium]|uniref:Uncharacterized protein n=1 Tax=Datura stramonium TaxID=4076 RepID=A0ABS8VCV5_DATST|nr:hypothetical protein [Datura stramonium]